MSKSQIKKTYVKSRGRVYQGDIFKDVSLYLGVSTQSSEKLFIKPFSLKYAVVLSQDCDLESDYSERLKNKERKKSGKKIIHDKYLHTILLCPAYLLSEFIQGKHLADLNMNDGLGTQRNLKKLKENNELKRYHFIKGDTSLGLPDLIVDFKHFFTVPRDEICTMRNKIYIVTLAELFREELSQRFTNFLSRIGLPVFSQKN